MKLYDMKRPKKKRQNTMAAEVPYEGDKYPYGLTIRLERDQINKLPGAEKLKTGDIVTLMSDAKVISTRIEERERGENAHTVELQLQKIGLNPKKSLSSMDLDEYRKERSR
ncbi:MAG: hypothetical protein DRH93_03325 [Deltaproteobacteria bacterium]|nr:MAG: hypothetical protein DRH93_03325 [Deltaproteobacteria bacterium]